MSKRFFSGSVQLRHTNRIYALNFNVRAPLISHLLTFDFHSTNYQFPGVLMIPSVMECDKLILKSKMTFLIQLSSNKLVLFQVGSNPIGNFPGLVNLHVILIYDHHPIFQRCPCSIGITSLLWWI